MIFFRKHGICFHVYADDNQSYLEFSLGEEKPAQSNIESCFNEVMNWMAVKWLKLNDSKTEVTIFGAKGHISKIDINSVTIGESSIPASACVKNIGATLDGNLKMENQISLSCRSAWFYLHHISKIKKCLDEEQTKSVIHADVTSQLDQNNSLLAGLPRRTYHASRLSECNSTVDYWLEEKRS